MKQIIIKPEGDKCKVEFVKDLSQELSKKVLTEATADFSYDRINFTDEERVNGFKTFTYIEDGVKYRIVVTANSESLNKNIEKIVCTIADNTAWYACLDDSKLSKMDKESSESRLTDSEIYRQILENKSVDCDEDAKMVLTFALTLISNIALASVGIYPVPFVVARYLIGIVAAYYEGEKINEYSIGAKIPMVLRMLALNGLPFIISSVSHKIATVIKNMIGDIKNDTFNLAESIKGLFKKRKKNTNSLEQELKEAKNSIEEARIDFVPYTYDQTSSISLEPVYIDLLEFTNYLKGRIEELPYENRGEYLAELNSIIENHTIKDLSQSSQLYVTTKDRLINLNNRIESLYYMIGDVINVDPLAEVNEYRKTG